MKEKKKKSSQGKDSGHCHILVIMIVSGFVDCFVSGENFGVLFSYSFLVYYSKDKIVLASLSQCCCSKRR